MSVLGTSQCVGTCHVLTHADDSHAPTTKDLFYLTTSPRKKRRRHSLQLLVVSQQSKLWHVFSAVPIVFPGRPEGYAYSVNAAMATAPRLPVRVLLSEE